MLARLQQAVIDNGNVFEVRMDAVRVCSIGQITHALFKVGDRTGAACRAVARARKTAAPPVAPSG